MATRFYLPSSGAPPVSPPYGGDAGNWDNTTFAARMALVITPSSTAMTTVADPISIKTNEDHLYRQGVSDLITAQTILAQTIKFQIRTQESNTAANLYTSLEIRVVSADGQTVRGTILTLERDDTEWENALVNRQFVSSLTTQVISQANDRIVIEFGQGGDPTGGGSHNDGTMRIGDNGGSDLPENDTDTNDYNPWVEFANTITFPTAPIVIPVDTAALTANGQVLALAPGAVSTGLNTAGLTAGGQALSLSMGVATVGLNTALLTVTGQALSLLMGAVLTGLNTAQITANGQIITVVITGGPITIPLDTALLQANGQLLTLAPGEATTLLNTAALTAGGQILSLLMGEAIIPLDTALLQANGQILSFLMGETTTILDTATLVAGGQAISFLMGEAVIALNTALLIANGQIITVILAGASITIHLDTALLTAGGQTLSLAPGEVSVSLDTAVLNSIGQILELSPGAVSTLLDTAELTVDGQNITISIIGAQALIVFKGMFRGLFKRMR